MSQQSKPFTDEELHRALEYIKERLSIQAEARDKLADSLYIAALKLIKLSRKYMESTKDFSFSMNKELEKNVDAIIDELEEELYSLTETYGTKGADDKTKKILLLYIASKIFGKTLKQRLPSYGKMFKTEVENLIASASVTKTPYNNVVSTAKTFVKNPKQSVIIQKAEKMGFTPNEYEVEGTIKISYGNFERVVIDTIARTRQKMYQQEEKEKHGTNAWYVMRGSSYPCSLCDMQKGIHKSDFELPPYHPNCVCLAIPIKINENE